MPPAGRLIGARALACSIVALFWLTWPYTALAESGAVPVVNVLVLHSAHQGRPLPRVFEHALRERLSAAKLPVEYDVEYLDAQRLRGQHFREAHDKMLAAKNRQRMYTLVFTTGPNALAWAISNKTNGGWLQGVPLVFANVRAVEDEIYQRYPEIRGVVIRDDWRRTLDFALALHPATDTLIFITPGLANRRLIESLIPDYRTDIKLQLWNEEHLEKLLARINQAPQQAILVPLAGPLLDRDRGLSLETFIETLSAGSDLPIYLPWLQGIGHGAVGGYMSDSEQHSAIAATLALDALAGRTRSPAPTLVRGGHYQVDARALRRFNIDDQQLPNGTLILNRQISWLSRNQALLWPMAIIFVALTGLIALLLFNISKRQAAERALRASEERYALAIQSDGEGIYDWELEDDQLFLSPDAYQVVGLNPHLLHSTGDWIERVHPEDKERVRQDLIKHLRGDMPRYVSEYRYQRSDGSWNWIRHHGLGLRDHNGKVYRIAGAVRDITQQKLQTQALEQSEEKFRNLIEGSIQGILIHSPEFQPVFANQACADMLGYDDPEEIVTRDSVEDHWAFHERERTKSFIEARLAGLPAPFEFEFDAIRRDNTSVVLQTIVRAIRWDDQVMIQNTLIDITEQKLLEEKLKVYHDHLEELVAARTAALEVSNKELESFSYSVSHDLRAPLRSIDGFSKALMEDYGDQLSEGAYDYLARVRKASQRMGTLIDNMLQLSRMTRREMTEEPVDLSGLARDISYQLQTGAPERNVDILVTPDLIAQGDTTLLQVALDNLIGNAWKYSRNREQAIIEFGVQNDELQPVYFVRDNGVGFDMKYANKLFSPFQRLHPVGEFEGTGIGLATVQRIIQRHGGQVWAEGQIGTGASFYFTLGGNHKL